MNRGYLSTAIREQGENLLHHLVTDLGQWKPNHDGTVLRGNCPWRSSSDSGAFRLGIALHGPLGVGGWVDETRADTGDLFDFAGRMLNLDPATDFPALCEECGRILGLKIGEYTVSRRPKDASKPMASMVSPDAETDFVANLIHDTDRAKHCVAELGGVQFLTTPLHRWAYLAVEKMLENGHEINVQSVSSFLANAGRIKAGTDSELLDMFPFNDLEGIPALANILKEAHARKQLYEMGSRIQIMAADPGKHDPLKITEDATKTIESVHGLFGSGGKAINDQVAASLTAIEDRQKAGGVGMRTGIRRLDEFTGGLLPGKLVIVAARPGMGKTAVAVGLSNELSVRQNRRGLVVTLEMTAEQWLQRMASHDTGIGVDKIDTGRVSDSELMHIASVSAKYTAAPLVIHDKPMKTTAQLRAAVNRVRMRYGGIDYVIFDHVHRLPVGNDRRTLIDEFSGAAKDLTLEFNIPFVLLAQLNRGVEHRDDKRPVLSDLKESGNLEQDADTVMFPFRPLYYQRSDTPHPPIEPAEIIIAKQRNGKLGTVTPLRFHSPTARYIDA